MPKHDQAPRLQKAGGTVCRQLAAYPLDTLQPVVCKDLKIAIVEITRLLFRLRYNPDVEYGSELIFQDLLGYLAICTFTSSYGCSN